MAGKSDKRHAQVADLMPSEWDRRPFGLASELRQFLSTIKDVDTSIDSGGSDGAGDLWVTVQGVEYFITIRKSNKQLIQEGKLLPPGDQLG